MKKFYKLFCIILCLILSISLFACKESGSAIDLYYFNTVIHLQTNDKKISDSTLSKIEQTLSLYQDRFDTEKDGSFVKAFNGTNVGESVSITSTDSEVISLAKECYIFTNGYFNPAVYPLVKLWKFDKTYSSTINFTPPTALEIENTLSTYSLDFDIVIDGVQNTATKTNNSLIDFGGIAKGIVADKIALILKDAGHSLGYVSVGSSSLNILSANELEVRHPRKSTTSLIKINTSGKEFLSVSTSGDYEREHTDSDGNTYSHIISPLTGSPIDTGIMSATILCENGGFADAVTTALLVCTYNEGESELTSLMKKITDKFADAQIYVALSYQGQNLLLTNKKQGEDFTLLDSDYTVINI